MRWIISKISESPLATIALFITVAVGLITIIEKAASIGMGLVRSLRSCWYWHVDRKVLQFLRTHDHSSLHEVADIANAIGAKRRITAESLMRLAKTNRARQFDRDIWGLHEYEERKES